MWKRLAISACLSTVLSLSLCAIYYNFIYSYLVAPKILLKGSKIETISLGSEYEEPGYNAMVGEWEANDNVVILSNVDNYKVGTYEIKYSIKNKSGKIAASKVRKIIVVDEERPSITLEKEEITLYKGGTYEEPGYKAIDNYDGDLTSMVDVNSQLDTSKVGTYYIDYVVKDTCGNKAVARRKVNVVSKPLAINTSGGVPILMYHFFYDSSIGEYGRDSNYIEISKFKEQMKYLHENNYYFPSWDELEKYIDGKIKLPSNSVVITVDDGHESFFRLAYPILQKYNVKATSFIITNWVDLNKYNIDGNYVDLQSHSDNMHRGGCSQGGGVFRCINYEEGYNDLTTSINILGSNDVFAYPFGHYSDSAIELLKATGFNMAVTTKYGKVYPGMDKYLLPRVRISGSSSLSTFINAIR